MRDTPFLADPPAEPVAPEAVEDQEDALLEGEPLEPEDEDADVFPAEEAVEERVDLEPELEAVDPFPLAERRDVTAPLLSARASAQAVAWNAAQHRRVSGIDPSDIRAALARSYIDLPSTRAAIDVANLKGAAIAIGTEPVDAVFVEAAHQFQRKCYADAKRADGLVGESTLDSLGLVSRSPKFNTVDRVHVRTQGVVRRVASELKTAMEAEPMKYTADNWFEGMVNPAFIGRPFTHGIHAVLARRLRLAERHLLSQPAFQGLTPAELGIRLGIREDHKGARPHMPKSQSVHTGGLAVDINYLGNPWVAGSTAASPSENKRFTDVVDRANLLGGGAPLRPNERLTPALLHSLAARSTSEAYDVLARHDTYLRRYFNLVGSVEAVRARLLGWQLQAHQDTMRQLIRPGEDVNAAARRWHGQIQDDRKALKSGSFSNGREPRDGFLNLKKELVVALRDAAGLAWGAVDFGPRSSGDIMHFDCRRDGVGRVVARALGGYVAPEAPNFPWGMWGGI